MTAPTPEQAAWSAHDRAHGATGSRHTWSHVDPKERAVWADVAQAAVDAATEGSLRACGYTLADVARFLETEAAATAQPAPGDDVSAARVQLERSREHNALLRADLADAEAQLAKWPRCPAGCSCRIGFEGDADRNECGCDGPCTTEGAAAAQPAPGLRADAETAELRADLGDSERTIARYREQVTRITADNDRLQAALRAELDKRQATPDLLKRLQADNQYEIPDLQRAFEAGMEAARAGGVVAAQQPLPVTGELERLRAQVRAVRDTLEGASAGSLASTPRGRLAKAVLSQLDHRDLGDDL